VPKTLVWKHLVGQKRIKDTIGTAFENRSLGHAYLFSGPAGVGKFQATLELAFALLCKDTEEVPCYSCDACRQIAAFSHPDFHCVFPLSLGKEHKAGGDSSKLSDEGWKYVAEQTRLKIQNPYTVTESRLRHIPVEWIRELNHSIMRGTIQGDINVAIICDVDVMQAASANAMLKTLEEPPPNTIIFLLTQRPHAVLPTLRSRCQSIRFGNVTTDEAKKALCEVTGLSPDDPKVIHAVATAAGSYGNALTLVEESLDVFAEQAQILWDLCIRKASLFTVTAALESVAKEQCGGGYDYAAGEKLLVAFLHIIRTTFFHGISGSEKYIKVTSSQDTTVPVTVEAAEQLNTTCEQAIAAIRTRGNILMVLSTFFMSISEIIHGKEQ